MAVSGSEDTVVAVSLRGTVIERAQGSWRKVYDGTESSTSDRCAQ